MIRLTLDAVCAVALGAAALASAEPSAETKVRVVKRAFATGKNPSAVTSVTATRTKAVIVEALARPRQRVTLTWRVACAALSGKRERQGHVTALTPVKRELAPPLRNPHACTVAATAR